MDPLAVFGAVLGVLGLRDPRTPKITSVQWDIRRTAEREHLALAVTVANDSKRPMTVVAAGTMFQPGQFDGGAIDGVPFKLNDGDEGTLWIRPLDDLLDKPEPVKVWVRTAVGKRAVSDVPGPRPQLSRGGPSNGDF